MSLMVIAESIIILFLLMGVGYLCRRSGVINQEGTRGLSSFVVNVSLPALIVMAMQVPITPPELVANAGGDTARTGCILWSLLCTRLYGAPVRCRL
ncbi:AEC family transporter [Methanogenium cariaci]|uniref:AEC family transporter n=1 Tax=Methanogenium cariaci TaxID=2197 RepID=UPI00078662DE|nr:AEC family transporter [Methanogenium cariaci]